MHKTYCDACGVEIERDFARGYYPSKMINGCLYQVSVQIECDIFDLCLKCVLKIVNEGEE